jgi:2-phospho-L-lactate/phosphoenolpyruvate guanylyltransferase
MPDVRADGDQWSVLVPVKRLEAAKTRIAVPAGIRADLALAMASDTVSAALASAAVAEVLVITNDSRARQALSALGARVVDDLPDQGLNPALVHGASLAAGQRVAALSSDLPGLRSADLTGVLRLAAGYALAVVADDSGVGTTLLAAGTRTSFWPLFGVESLAAHVGVGAVDLSPQAAASVRHDVDTLAALRTAVDLGVGAQTARLVAGAVEHLR